MGLTRDELLKQGFAEVNVRASGMRQLHKFVVKREKTAFGEVPFLIVSTQLAQSEILRVAEEFQLPVKSGIFTAFPKGKMARDFVGL